MKGRIVSLTSDRMGTWHLQKAWRCLRARTPAIGNNRLVGLDQKREDDIKEVKHFQELLFDLIQLTWPPKEEYGPLSFLPTSKKIVGVVKYICPKVTMIGGITSQLRVD